ASWAVAVKLLASVSAIAPSGTDPPSFGSSPEQPELNTVLHAITIGDATAVIRRAARDTCAVRDTISVMTGIDTRAILDVQGLCLTPRRAHGLTPSSPEAAI